MGWPCCNCSGIVYREAKHLDRKSKPAEAPPFRSRESRTSRAVAISPLILTPNAFWTRTCRMRRHVRHRYFAKIIGFEKNGFS
jgi:hypothetical protein